MARNSVGGDPGHRDKAAGSWEEGAEGFAGRDLRDSSVGMLSMIVVIGGHPHFDIARRCADKVATRRSAVVVGSCLLAGGIHRRR